MQQDMRDERDAQIVGLDDALVSATDEVRCQRQAQFVDDVGP